MPLHDLAILLQEVEEARHGDRLLSDLVFARCPNQRLENAERACECRVVEAEAALGPLRFDVFRNMLHEGGVDALVLPREEVVVAHYFVEDQHQTLRGLLFAYRIHDVVHAVGIDELGGYSVIAYNVLDGL